MKSIPLEEQETTVNLYRAEDNLKVYTCDSTIITKLDKLVKRDPEHVKVEQPDEYGKMYTMPKGYLKFRVPMALTDEQRAVRSELGKRNRQNQLSAE